MANFERSAAAATQGPAVLSRSANGPPQALDREPLLRRHPLGEEDLEKRLVRHVALVRERLEIREQRGRQAERYRRGRWLEVREADDPPLRPIDVVGRIVGLPELPFLLLAAEARNRLPLARRRLAHARIPFVRVGSSDEPK